MTFISENIIVLHVLKVNVIQVFFFFALKTHDLFSVQFIVLVGNPVKNIIWHSSGLRTDSWKCGLTGPVKIHSLFIQG